VNILKDIHRNKLGYMKQFQKTVKESLVKIKTRKDKDEIRQ